MGKRIVLALGGNALGNTPKEQEKAVKLTAKSIVDLIDAGHQVVVGHGNGPQVGMISLAFNEGSKTNERVPEISLALAGAMSQGYIGIHLKQAITNELTKRSLTNKVYALVSQAIVDANDKAFQNPTKPIGSFYTKEQAEQLAQKNNWTVQEDAGRGWRRMVPSPIPIDLMEKALIKTILSANDVVIAGGGGGIPSIIKNNQVEIVDAVIDKDFTAEMMAELVEADIFMIVTAVDGIYLNYNKPDQQILLKPSVARLEELLTQNAFPAGSMAPKVEASVKFAKSKPGRIAVITSLEKMGDSLDDKVGSHIKI